MWQDESQSESNKLAIYEERGMKMPEVIWM